MGSEQVWTWLPVVLLGLTGVPQIQTALWLLRNLSQTSSKWRLKGGCSFFPQNTLLTPFFLSSSISQSFSSPTFLSFFFLLSTRLGGNNLKGINTQCLFSADKGTSSSCSTSCWQLDNGSWPLPVPTIPMDTGSRCLSWRQGRQQQHTPSILVWRVLSPLLRANR